MKPATVDELIAWFEKEFQCFIGPALAFFEIPLGPGFSYYGSDNAIFRGIYYVFAVKTRSEVDAEKRLVDAMFNDFSVVPRNIDGSTALFWRLPEKIALMQNGHEWVLRTRLSIPTVKYPPMLTRKAEGAEILMIEYGNAHG